MLLPQVLRLPGRAMTFLRVSDNNGKKIITFIYVHQKLITHLCLANAISFYGVYYQCLVLVVHRYKIINSIIVMLQAHLIYLSLNSSMNKSVLRIADREDFREMIKQTSLAVQSLWVIINYLMKKTGEYKHRSYMYLSIYCNSDLLFITSTGSRLVDWIIMRRQLYTLPCRIAASKLYC